MFQQFQNIETAFKHVRLFSFILIAAFTLILCFTIYQSEQRVKQAEDRVLILLNGKVIQAMASSRKDNIGVEARDHIKTFHELFFTLSPDDQLIRKRIGQSLYLADGSAKKQYDDLTESGYYNGIVSGNVSQELIVDSIRVELSTAPYYFRFYGSEKLIRPTSTLSRSLVTEGYLREVSRSDNNTHGFLIEKWRIIENSDLEVQAR